MKNFFAYLQYLLVKGLMLIMEHAPRGIHRGLASFLSSLASPLPAFGGLVRTNLRCAFPEKSEKEIRSMTKESLKSLIMTFCEFFWLHNKPEIIRNLLEFQPGFDDAIQAVREAKKQNRPLIFITPHFGNWELSGMGLALIVGYKTATVVRTPRNPYLDKLISEGRSVRNVKIIHSRGGMRELVRDMENGYCAGMLIDQNTKVRNGGIFVDFFGFPCPVSRFPATMALKKNAFIVIGGTIRRKDGRFNSYLRLMPKETCEYKTEKEITQDITRLSEELIRLAPEQYLWLYKRFQYIPPETPDELRKRFPDYAYEPPPSFYSNAERAKEYRKRKSC